MMHSSILELIDPFGGGKSSVQAQVDSIGIFLHITPCEIRAIVRGVQNIRLTRQLVQPTTDLPTLCGSLS